MKQKLLITFVLFLFMPIQIIQPMGEGKKVEPFKSEEDVVKPEDVDSAKKLQERYEKTREELNVGDDLGAIQTQISSLEEAINEQQSLGRSTADEQDQLNKFKAAEKAKEYLDSEEVQELLKKKEAEAAKGFEPAKKPGILSQLQAWGTEQWASFLEIFGSPESVARVRSDLDKLYEDLGPEYLGKKIINAKKHAETFKTLENMQARIEKDMQALDDYSKLKNITTDDEKLEMFKEDVEAIFRDLIRLDQEVAAAESPDLQEEINKRIEQVKSDLGWSGEYYDAQQAKIQVAREKQIRNLYEAIEEEGMNLKEWMLNDPKRFNSLWRKVQSLAQRDISTFGLPERANIDRVMKDILEKAHDTLWLALMDPKLSEKKAPALLDKFLRVNKDYMNAARRSSKSFIENSKISALQSNYKPKNPLPPDYANIIIKTLDPFIKKMRANVPEGTQLYEQFAKSTDIFSETIKASAIDVGSLEANDVLFDASKQIIDAMDEASKEISLGQKDIVSVFINTIEKIRENRNQNLAMQQQTIAKESTTEQLVMQVPVPPLGVVPPAPPPPKPDIPTKQPTQEFLNSIHQGKALKHVDIDEVNQQRKSTNQPSLFDSIADAMDKRRIAIGEEKDEEEWNDSLLNEDWE